MFPSFGGTTGLWFTMAHGARVLVASSWQGRERDIRKVYRDPSLQVPRLSGIANPTHLDFSSLSGSNIALK